VVFSPFAGFLSKPTVCSVLVSNGSPFGFCRPEAPTDGTAVECTGARGVSVPGAKGLMVLGVYCDAMQPWYLSGSLCRYLIIISIMLNTGVFSFSGTCRFVFV